jgi:outer membrane protein OmpA-like peptidoglycan-associated protein
MATFSYRLFVRYALLAGLSMGLLSGGLLSGCACQEPTKKGAAPIIAHDQTRDQRHFLSWLEKTGIQVIHEGESLRFIIPADLLYPPAGITLKASGQSILDIIADIIHDHKNPSVTIIGHTDNVGSEAEKLNRSVYQAHNVAAYLWGHDVQSSSIKIIGTAQHQPVSNHQYIDRYATNRRIEIRLF